MKRNHDMTKHYKKALFRIYRHEHAYANAPKGLLGVTRLHQFPNISSREFWLRLPFKRWLVLHIHVITLS